MTYDELLNRVAKIEHALRRASDKFAWLGMNHCEGNKFATIECAKLSNEFWKAQESDAIQYPDSARNAATGDTEINAGQNPALGSISPKEVAYPDRFHYLGEWWVPQSLAESQAIRIKELEDLHLERTKDTDRIIQERDIRIEGYEGELNQAADLCAGYSRRIEELTEQLRIVTIDRAVGRDSVDRAIELYKERGEKVVPRTNVEITAICHAYETGHRQGLRGETLPNPYSEGGDSFRAYAIGHKEGTDRNETPEWYEWIDGEWRCPCTTCVLHRKRFCNPDKEAETLSMHDSHQAKVWSKDEYAEIRIGGHFDELTNFGGIDMKTDEKK